MNLAREIRKQVIRHQRPMKLRELANLLTRPIEVIGGRVGTMVKRGVMRKQEAGYEVLREPKNKRMELHRLMRRR